ncbi:hypothetical protein [Armatimonas sp.]|uniref:hypothetical protein n=1 Tax=Armatimonas sp. TaxID=1872638 RepID=UPI00374CF7BA
MGFLPQAPPAIAIPQPAAQSANSTLVSVVPNLYWNVSARGPLLIVGAEKYSLVSEPKPIDFFSGSMGGMFAMMPDMEALTGQKKPVVTPLGAAPREGWNTVQVAQRFGAQVVRCGGVSVLAPQLLPDKSKSTSPFSDPDMKELMQEGMAMGMGMSGSRLLPLLASLSVSQLQQASSSSGLPLSSLDTKQRALAQPLLRRTLPFRFAQKPNFPDAGPLGTPQVIPAADQNQFRLRLSRALNLAPNLPEFGAAGGGGARLSMQFGNLINDSDAPGNTRTLALKAGKAPNPMAFMALLGGGPTGNKGVPARRKPSDLNPDSGGLNGLISLTGVATVDELVARIAQVTKVPLFADQRIGKLKISARGTSARAGDLVEALCVAVGGAVRRISDDKESVYLLTDQVALKTNENPMSAMMAPISGMMQDQRSAERLAKDAKIRLIRQATLRALPRGTGASFGAKFWQIAEAKPTGDGNMVSLGELPTELQKQAQERHDAFSGAIANIPDGTPGITRRDPQPLTQVRCSQSIVLELVAPTLGAVATLATADANEIHPELPVPAPPPAVTLPSSLKQRVVTTALPSNEAQAAALVASAVARGLTELRVSVPVGKDKELALLGAEAKGKIEVVAVLAPLEPLTADAVRDKSWSGQSLTEWIASPESTKLIASMPPQLAPMMGRMLGADFVTPESADVAGFVARAKRLLALPGITGFALERLAAPGYRDGAGGMGDGAGFFWQGGANARERVAFTKDQKSDAAELGGFNFADIFNAQGPRVAWGKRTTARNDAFLKRLDTVLTKETLAPVSVLASVQPPRWEKWTGKYPAGATITSALRPALKIFSYSTIFSQPALFGDASDFAGFDEPDQFTGVLGKELQKLNDPEATVRWDGIVIDLADQPVETALALLERALVPK